MGRIVERVIDKLEGNAEVSAIAIERFFFLTFSVCYDAPIRQAAAKSAAVFAEITSK